VKMRLGGGGVTDGRGGCMDGTKGLRVYSEDVEREGDVERAGSGRLGDSRGPQPMRSV